MRGTLSLQNSVVAGNTASTSRIPISTARSPPTAATTCWARPSTTARTIPRPGRATFSAIRRCWSAAGQLRRCHADPGAFGRQPGHRRGQRRRGEPPGDRPARPVRDGRRQPRYRRLPDADPQCGLHHARPDLPRRPTIGNPSCSPRSVCNLRISTATRRPAGSGGVTVSLASSSAGRGFPRRLRQCP